MLSQDITALRQHFADNFDPAGLPVIYQNAPLTDIAEGAPFLRFTVIPGASFHRSGDGTSGTMVQQGRVWLNISIPEGTGDALMLTVVDAFSACFRNQRIDQDIICKTPDVGSATTRDGYLSIAVSIPWESYRHY